MKNPFANLFKKKSKDGAPDKPVPKPDAGKKKEGFFFIFCWDFDEKKLKKINNDKKHCENWHWTLRKLASFF